MPNKHQWLMSRWRYHFSYDHWSQTSWVQPVFRWIKPSAEWGVLTKSKPRVPATPTLVWFSSVNSKWWMIVHSVQLSDTNSWQNILNKNSYTNLKQNILGWFVCPYFFIVHLTSAPNLKSQILNGKNMKKSIFFPATTGGFKRHRCGTARTCDGLEVVLAAGQQGVEGRRRTYTNIMEVGSGWIDRGPPPHIVSHLTVFLPKKALLTLLYILLDLTSTMQAFIF